LHDKNEDHLQVLYEISKIIAVSYQQQQRALYYLGDQLKKNELGAACGIYGVEDRCIQSFGGET
jgi:hypothetical protein